MEKLKKGDSVFLHTKRYFSKSEGNSYFASRLWVNGELVAGLPFQYGYGSADEYAAVEELLRRGFIGEEFETKPLWRLEDLGVTVYTVPEHWDTKKEIKRFGKVEG